MCFPGLVLFVEKYMSRDLSAFVFIRCASSQSVDCCTRNLNLAFPNSLLFWLFVSSNHNYIIVSKVEIYFAEVAINVLICITFNQSWLRFWSIVDEHEVQEWA